MKLSSGEESTLANAFKWRLPVMIAAIGCCWFSDQTVPSCEANGPVRVRPPPLLRGPMKCLRTTVLVI